MCATTSAETNPEEQKPQNHQGNWDCQAWSLLANIHTLSLGHYRNQYVAITISLVLLCHA